MRLDKLTESIQIPSGVTVAVTNGEFTVKGPKGELKRRLYNDHITSERVGDTVTFTSLEATKREKTNLFTLVAHFRNMIQGVTEGHSYKLKVCSGHFPMTVAMKGESLEVKNFIGEAVPRTLKINKIVKVVVDGQIITVESSDLEAAGQTAARIEGLCKRAGFDKRIFQDGIYITHKGEKQV